jgi:4-amino-4-deoxy-L-arabinose transferase-like glycosyltransferase
MKLRAALLIDDSFRAPRSIFWTALLVRVAYILVAHSYRVIPINNHFEFGWETGRVAASLAGGHGYSSPFSGDTGPTAWMVPGFTLLLAGVFKVFGIYSALSAFVIETIDSLFQALTVLLVYEMGARTAGRRTAVWAAWIWALYPGIIQYSTHWIWETSLSTMLFAAVLVLGMRMRGTGAAAPQRHRLRDWVVFGLLWGAISMTNPTLLLMAPVEGVWILDGLPGRRNLLRGAVLALLSGALCAAVAAPWVVRNWVVFHAFIPTRDNFGAEAAMAWAPDSEGFPWGATVPTSEIAPEHQLYAQMGELAYVKMRGAQAREWARQNPAHFWKLVALRFYMFWASVPHTSGGHPAAEYLREFAHCFGSITGILGLLLALRRRLPAAGLFAWAVGLLPLIYYFITVGSRFRNPLEPFLVILIVYLFQQTKGRWGFTLPGLRRFWPTGANAPEPVQIDLTPQSRYTNLVWRFLPVAVETLVRPQIGLE